MIQVYAAKLDFKIQPTDVKAQKIDGLLLTTFEIVIVSFLIFNKLDQACFFQKTFLLVNISAKVVLKKLFLVFSNANNKFAAYKRIWRFYTSAKYLPTIKQIELINKKNFAKTALD